MPRIRNYVKFLIAACIVLSFCFVEAGAQTRKKKRSRRAPKPPVAQPVITNPSIAPATESATQPASGEVKIISTADGAEVTTAAKPKDATPADSPENDEMKQTITTLSNQVNRLNNRLSQMQDDDRYQMDMERLTRAEQRAEQLRSQLIDTQGKIADFESRLEQIEWALKPENIESAMSGYGSTRPEQAREARRKQLESERARVQAQLKLTETSRMRLETACANADAEVDHLRMKLNQRREQMEAAPANEPVRPRKPE